MQITIPYVSSELEYAEWIYNTWEEEFNYKTEKIEDGSKAIFMLTKRKYPIAFFELKLWNFESTNFPEISEIIQNCSNPWDYVSVGLHVLKKIREPTSANKDTPIIVCDTYDPLMDRFVGTKFGQRCIDAGATEYHDKHDLSIDKIREILLKYKV